MMPHFIRPEALWAALPLIAIVLLLLRRTSRVQQWQHKIDPKLLPWLLVGNRGRGHAVRNSALMTSAALLTLLAMTGPSWKKLPAPGQQTTENLAVVLDLSPSMLAEDVQPSRIEQAKYKLRDLLELRREGRTALVVFGGDAFVVSPLTDDVETLRTLLPSLEPSTMPLQGSNPLAGLQRAEKLLQGAGSGDGRILLITDGVTEGQLNDLRRYIRASDYPLSVLGVGTDKGAPIPLPQGGFAKDEDGGIIIPGLPRERLQELAHTDGGRYRDLSLENSDLKYLVQVQSQSGEISGHRERNFDQWADAGHYFVLALLPLALLCFRRGWLLCLPLLLVPPPSHAFDFKDLWQTPDQQAAQRLDSDPQRAAELFEDPHWRGIAQYRAGDYEAAAETLSELDSARAHYNRGNALAKAKRLQQAQAAYEKALERDPDNEDARHNLRLVEEMLKRQQQRDGQEARDGRQQQQGEQDDRSSGERRSQPSPSAGGRGSQSDRENGELGNTEPREETAEQQRQAEKYAASAEEQDKANRGDSETTPEPSQERTGEKEKRMAAQGSKEDDRDPAAEQWLRKIPEENADFMKRKFYYQYRERQENNEQPAPENIAPY